LENIDKIHTALINNIRGSISKRPYIIPLILTHIPIDQTSPPLKKAEIHSINSEE
jgi:hypothetical protein